LENTPTAYEMLKTLTLRRLSANEDLQLDPYETKLLVCGLTKVFFRPHDP